MTNTRKSDASDELIELRARVEALEARQHAHADVTRLSDAEREQFYAEMAKPATEWLPSTALLHGGSPAANTEARPAGLVERAVQALINTPHNLGDWKPETRAVIREVAAWLDGQTEICAAHLLREEVENG